MVNRNTKLEGGTFATADGSALFGIPSPCLRSVPRFEVEPKVGDVVLAWVEKSRYVVHRIIKIEGEDVTLMGDGNISGTERCTLSDVKALATHVVGRDERPRDLYTSWRKRAAKAWWHIRPIRRYILAIYKRL